MNIRNPIVGVHLDFKGVQFRPEYLPQLLRDLASQGLIAIEGEPVSHYGNMILDAYPNGVTFPLGYANDEALYLVTSNMLEEGGMEPTSHWEYGFPAPLAAGMEIVVSNTLRHIRALGIN